MTLQQQIYQTIWKAKFYSSTLFTELSNRITYGEDVVVTKQRFIILDKWIEILQFYYDNNFDSTGVIDPIIDCLSEQQVQELMAKVKVMIGNNRYALDRWLLAYGAFMDSGVWIDTDVWNDYVPLN